MFEIVSPQEAARMISGFLLGAAMQQDPFLDELGSIPEEPPDEDPCWDAKPNEEPSLEQGTLFDLPSQEPKKPKATHPVRSQKQTKPVTEPVKQVELPKPYVPYHYPFKDFLKFFCGDYKLAMHWFSKQINPSLKK